MRPPLAAGLCCIALFGLTSQAADAQSLGTFRWQLRPYCNVVTVGVTQTGGVYRLEGTDDQCGGGRDLASVQGLAFPNPDGTIGFGLTIVTAPGGAAVHVDAEITIATLGGSWRDSTGATGTFAFTPGAGTGGNPRPPAAAAIPPAFLLAPTGNLLATGTIGVGTAPASGPGVRMMWYPGKAAFRAGRASGSQWDNANIGEYSAAMGITTVASGGASTALGWSTTASGIASTAMGQSTTASGWASTAMGVGTIASALSGLAGGYNSRAAGPSSVALGLEATATGGASIALGERVVANGNNSIALGRAAVANGYDSIALGRAAEANGHGSIALGRGFTTEGATGSFVFSDDSNSNRQVAFAPNTFVVRAAGGGRFFSHPTDDLGPVLLAGGSDWLAVSDVNRKHQFRELDGEDVLGRIARMPVTEWSYKAQDPAVRHIGPTAQDFHAAFGLGQDPLRISPLDSGGVALASVKALEARTRRLQEENSTLREALEELRGELEALKARVSP